MERTDEPDKIPVMVVVAIVVALFSYGALDLRDQSATTEKVTAAIHNMPQESDKEERQLEGHAFARRLDDVVEDIENTQPSNNP